MKTLFLPYHRQFDEETGTWCLTGRDSEGQEFGVAAAETIEDAEDRLRSWVLDSLLASAADGEDRISDLSPYRPQMGPAIAFSGADLLPVRLRLARVRRGLSQARLAEILGKSQQAYAKLERPGANPQIRTIQQIERAIDEELLQLV
ncbi:MAG TPA: helix-turn-helix transcriptional regulator [Candidatus Dormibacteraeota bacterium]|nr:helix-turn-helix transcriptional regulator [Candidatus Dormibacteraeota bacterium]